MGLRLKRHVVARPSKGTTKIVCRPISGDDWVRCNSPPYQILVQIGADKRERVLTGHRVYTLFRTHIACLVCEGFFRAVHTAVHQIAPAASSQP